ncbi:hypothetical protein [uncultured Enterovirga sp.]|uniref:hypothetical protein n=1 Tax=uncultured Enterovirga sp. TaxID=2026352 RepID=UPI0035CB8225
MRFTLSALVVSVGLAGFGMAAHAAPVSTTNPLGSIESSDIHKVQMMDRMERRMMRRRMERRMDRRMERRVMRRKVERRMMRGM